MNTVGIDFGTTKTLVAVVRDGRPECIALGRSGPEIPTTLHVDANGAFLFADDADDQIALDPDGYVRRLKRDLGSGKQHRLHGVSFSTVELVSRFLAHLKDRIETECLHGSIDHAVITHPAKFSPAAISDLREAVINAGFASFDLLEEPVAAGIAFLEEKRGTELGESILVFDWGGGTLDIALVESRNGDLHINHDQLEGDTRLGGEDIDDALLDAFKAACSEQPGLPPIESWNTETYCKAQKRLVQMKEVLSKKEEYSFTHVIFDKPIPFKRSRQELEKIIEPLTDRALACFQRWQDSTNDSTTPVLLVGGTSQIPVVKRLLEANDQVVLKWNHSERAVAVGAAIKASLSVTSSRVPTKGDNIGVTHQLTEQEVSEGHARVSVNTGDGRKLFIVSLIESLGGHMPHRLRKVGKPGVGGGENGDAIVTFLEPVSVTHSAVKGGSSDNTPKAENEMEGCFRIASGVFYGIVLIWCLIWFLGKIYSVVQSLLFPIPNIWGS
jgi:molecular chaperone DnaK (HSP70)